MDRDAPISRQLCGFFPWESAAVFHDDGWGIGLRTFGIHLPLVAFLQPILVSCLHSSPHHKNQGDYDRETERDERDFLTELDLKEFVDPVDGVREGGNEEQ